MRIIDPAGFLGGKMPLNETLARRAFERLDSPFTVDELVRNAYKMTLNNIAEGMIDITIRPSTLMSETTAPLNSTA